MPPKLTGPEKVGLAESTTLPVPVDVVTPVPPRATGSVPVVAADMSIAVTGMVMLAEPLKLVAVPVTAPDIAIVRAVASAFAVPALPVTLV